MAEIQEDNKAKISIRSTVVLLTAGHGGMLEGKYMTTGKRSPVWSNGRQLFEGEFNRQIKYRVMELLEFANIPYIDIVPEHTDTRRLERVERINDYYATNKNCFLLDIHANAGRGTGVELWLSHKASSRSEAIASSLQDAYLLGEHLPLRWRGIKRKDFDMIALTHCPACLIEAPFMDTEQECQEILLTSQGRDRVARWIFNGIQRALHKLNRL